ncbi:ATP-binding protein [Polaromonas sp.]|uniref:sensor histidine kinase n=1 Tax=Polaromonas sp. TaxID=1869339 RepID=UPI001DA2D53F|nr:PAS domain-containing sensor histidine kinase [Polaromonas sp.]MBT9476965.1 PAS domain-containing protein [Polaromonas sp.]
MPERGPPENELTGKAPPAELTMLDWSPLGLANDGMVRLDGSGRITDANARALELLQCTLEAVSGRDIWDAVPEEIAEQHESATIKAMQTSGRHAFVAHQRFEGRWIEYTFRRDASGQAVSLSDVSSTQRLQHLLEDSERYNQLLFDANPTAMWMFDRRSLRILAANQAAASFYGISRREFVTLRMDALFDDGEGAALMSDLAPREAGREVRFELRLCKQRKLDGGLVLVELACGHVMWNEHQAVLVSLADVTQRHLGDSALRRVNAELGLALAQRQTELVTARRDLDAFTHAVSSDLRDSLHVANGFATTLAEKYASVLDGQGMHYVSRIQASTRQLARLVDDLRTLAQLSQLSGDLETVDLVPLCRSQIADLTKRDPDRVLALEMTATLPVVGDRRLLGMALACMLENAWKFTSKKTEAWIKVALLPGKLPDALVLVVSDNGAGFDAAYGEKLFSAFQRLHSSADFPGNGLGLAIVKGVAARHGGEVWAESAGQSGASFFMTLPQGAPPAP